MGLKRPFDAEEMQECNAKHARQLSYSPKHLNQSDESIPYHAPLEKTGFLADNLSGLCEKKPTWSTDHVEKDFDTCAPFSWNPTSFCEEDGTTQSSLSQQSSGSDFTWRPLSPVEDVYTCLMKHAPTKEVPVGSNHQAYIPEYVKEEILDRSETRRNDQVERKLMGKCIIPMPESDVCDVVGQGRKECLCLDKGSVRCVRLHVMEARERLIKTIIGYDRFRELGFCEMGEEVAELWTENEEDLFHKVVYSNPFSMGRKFWKLLMATFPSRTMKELVSYYFNVFILQRRATQNRFRTLDVDSDDDEWQVEYDEEEEETNSNDEEDSPSNDAHCVYMDKEDSRGGEVNVEDDSCMSFELQDSNLIFSHSSIENRECHRSGDDESFSFDDDCDGRLTPSDCWIKNNDLLPTSNIIEEIFGQDDEWGENDNDNDDNSKGK
uniref:AT-rich interactive domain-containing protein 2 n=1 Tax=Noccaea caerulescens TaxID=107243 RepID=A0A1J3C934_NOCCA